MNRLLLTLLLLFGTCTVAVADDLNDGIAAYRSNDYATGFAKFTKAAEAGNADAQAVVGAMYDDGEGVPQDYGQAVRWYTKAAEAGNADAQGRLASMYAVGHGVPQDFVQAYKWFNIAVSTETDKEERDRSVRNRDLVSGKMTPNQIAEAQRLAREWKPKR